MSLASVVLVLTLVWAVIYALNYCLKSSRNYSLLPSTTTNCHTHRSIWTQSTTTVALKGLHFRIQTTAWNLTHDILCASLGSSQKARLRRVLKQFYDLGSVLCLMGMLVALGFLVTTGGTSAVSLARKLWVSPPDPFATRDVLTKRSVDPFTSTEAQSSDTFIKPIIPGVTVPLSHLPVILAVVFLTQLVHEIGHAFAAAIESLPILSVGASYTVFFPSAFVNFSTAALDNLVPRARARVVAAGPFHNLLLWGILVAVGYTHVGSIFWSVGYRDVSPLGRVVVRVDTKSPLYQYLPVGSVITALDDTLLGSQNAFYDGWSTYLNQSRHDQSFGWCAALPEKNDSCCSGDRIPELACFVSLESPSTRGCLDPIPIMSHVDSVGRCTADTQCSMTHRCIKPDISEQLLRMTVQGASLESSQVILWRGPAEEIWEEVQVGNLLPRIPLLPVSLPHSVELFWEYLLMASLSLFFFNLLPLPYLDGSQFLNAILEASLKDSGVVHPDDFELEAVEERRRPRRSVWWKELLVWLIPELTLGLLAVCTLLGVLNVYWH